MPNQSTASSRVSEPFLWLGGQLALDFLNTEPNVRGRRIDLLDGFERLLAWCAEAELVSAEVAAEVLRRWAASEEAARTLDTAHRLRRELRVALEHREAKSPKRSPCLDTLNACLRLEGRAIEVDTAPRGRFVRRAHVELTRPQQLLRPIADAAAELLCDLEPALVRRCGNAECALYFHDVSKNHARRWCSMALCGNRMKVAAHAARQRSRDGSGSRRGEKRR
jgi:predicted RNA-binding Zn ribbon-like protein